MPVKVDNPLINRITGGSPIQGSVVSTGGSTPPILLAQTPRGARAARRPSPSRRPSAMDYPVFQDAMSMLLLIRSENAKSTSSVRLERARDAKEMKKALEQARQIALKAAEEAAEKAGFWGDVLSVVKAVATVAAVAATIASGGIASPATAGMALMLLGDFVGERLKDLGVDPEVADLIAVGIKLTGAIMTMQPGAIVQAGSEAFQSGVELLGGELPPEFMLVATGIAVLVSFASMLSGGGSGSQESSGEAAKSGTNASPAAPPAGGSSSSDLEKIVDAIVEALEKAGKAALDSAKWIRAIATLSQAVAQYFNATFEYESEDKNIKAKELQIDQEELAKVIEEIIEFLGAESKKMAKFESKVAEAISIRNEARSAATRNLA